MPGPHTCSSCDGSWSDGTPSISHPTRQAARSPYGSSGRPRIGMACLGGSDGEDPRAARRRPTRPRIARMASGVPDHREGGRLLACRSASRHVGDYGARAVVGHRIEVHRSPGGPGTTQGSLRLAGRVPCRHPVHDRCSGGQAESEPHPADEGAHRGDGDGEPAGDDDILQSLPDEQRDLEFACGQAAVRWVGCVQGRRRICGAAGRLHAPRYVRIGPMVLSAARRAAQPRCLL